MGLAPRALHEQPIGFAARVAPDDSAHRVGCTTVDAEHIESPRTHDALVQAVVGDHDRTVEIERVEVAAAGEDAGGELVPAGGPYPVGVRFSSRVLGEAPPQVVDFGNIRDVGPAGMQRGDRQVAVGVDESRSHGSTLEIHDVQLGFAQRDDPLAVDHQHIRAHVAVVHGEDVTAGERDPRHPQWHCSGGGTSSAGLRSKKPTGTSWNPQYSTGMTGQSSGRGTCVTPNVCHTTMSVPTSDRSAAVH